MIRILIADDHAIVREGLKQILSDTPDMLVAGEASDGRETLDKIRAEKWDVVLIDISMPLVNGLDVLKQLKSERPKLPVIILSMYPEDLYAVRALRAGASGYLTKHTAPKELVTAIRKVAQGRKYVSPSLAEKLAFDLDAASEKQPHEILSDREFQVMCLLASGKALAEIARDLSLSLQTVSTYRARVLEKMNMKNNADIIRYAIENRLVE